MILLGDMVRKSYLFKILVAGEGGVGKTTLLYRYIKEEFLKDTEMTIGLDFFSKNIKLDGLDITLQFWDFGGQDRFQFLHDYYTKGASGAILMFDLSMGVIFLIAIRLLLILFSTNFFINGEATILTKV